MHGIVRLSYVQHINHPVHEQGKSSVIVELQTPLQAIYITQTTPTTTSCGDHIPPRIPQSPHTAKVAFPLTPATSSADSPLKLAM